MASRLARSTASTQLLARVLDTPNLVRELRALPPGRFAALVRQVGLEDSGELVALASTRQLVAAFDEDLFVNERPGEPERFDGRRFALWLEVLLEAGDDVAARRVAELSEDFVSLALSSLMIVLDNEALLTRLEERDADAIAADKVIEDSLNEQIEGYLLIAREPEAWDSVMSLVLALDREDRELLERVLDRCARAASEYLDELAVLTGVLTDAESLADDVGGERDQRRGARGFVEPQAARSFLELARRPAKDEGADADRDPVTRAYFRELEPTEHGPGAVEAEQGGLAALLSGQQEDASPMAALPAGGGASAELDGLDAGDGGHLAEAMRALADRDAAAFDARMEELAYLANVLLSGAERSGRRLEPAEAAQAALATVMLGAELEAGGGRSAERATASGLLKVLGASTADRLFRRASSALAALPGSPHPDGVLHDIAEVGALLARMSHRPA